MKAVVYFSNDFLIKFKTNFDEIADLYVENERDKLEKMFEDGEVYFVSNLSFKYKHLLNEHNSNLASNERMRENIKNLYESLKHLTPTQAKDERLWSAMYNKYWLYSVS